MNPHGNSGLANDIAGQIAQPFGERDLTTSNVNCGVKRVITHIDTQNNTHSVIDVNTRSVVRLVQNSGMPKSGNESDFWRRLKLARESHTPALSMRQEDLRADTGMTYQSAVTKWKTGGPDGTTKPKPEIVEKLAIQAGVSFDWLYTGRGSMKPLPDTDQITARILEVLQGLSAEKKVDVLKAALAQKAFDQPDIQLQIQAAEKTARQLGNDALLKTNSSRKVRK